MRTIWVGTLVRHEPPGRDSIFFSGPAADVQVLYDSTSSVPSVHPLWTLQFGNNFTQLYPLVVTTSAL